MDVSTINQEVQYSCSGPRRLKVKRVGYQSKQKLLHHYEHSDKYNVAMDPQY